MTTTPNPADGTNFVANPTYDGWFSGTFRKPTLRDRARRAPLLVKVAAGAVAAGLLFGAGTAVGQATAPTRPACTQALNLAEQALNDSSDAMQVFSDGLSGGISGMLSIGEKIAPITSDIKSVGPQYKAAKSECTK